MMACRGCRDGIALDEKLALQDAYDDTRELGAPVTFILNLEGNVARGTLNNIKQRGLVGVDGLTTISGCASEGDFTGTGMERFATGQKDTGGLTLTVPMLIFYDLGLNTDELEDIEIIRARVIYRNSTYQITQMGLTSQYGQVYLFGTFTLKRE
jgi:hypothetical protein